MGKDQEKAPPLVQQAKYRQLGSNQGIHQLPNGSGKTLRWCPRGLELRGNQSQPLANGIGCESGKSEHSSIASPNPYAVRFRSQRQRMLRSMFCNRNGSRSVGIQKLWAGGGSDGPGEQIIWYRKESFIAGELSRSNGNGSAEVGTDKFCHRNGFSGVGSEKISTGILSRSPGEQKS